MVRPKVVNPGVLTEGPFDYSATELYDFVANDIWDIAFQANAFQNDAFQICRYYSTDVRFKFQPMIVKQQVVTDGDIDFDGQMITQPALGTEGDFHYRID